MLASRALWGRRVPACLGMLLLALGCRSDPPLGSSLSADESQSLDPEPQDLGAGDLNDADLNTGEFDTGEADPEAFRVGSTTFSVGSLPEVTGSQLYTGVGSAEISTTVSREETIEILRRDSPRTFSLADVEPNVSLDFVDANQGKSDDPGMVMLGSYSNPLILETARVPNDFDQRFHGVPAQAGDVSELRDCVGPTTRDLHQVSTNIFGIVVAEVSYAVDFQYGCKFQNRGQYIINATVYPSHIWSLWGFQIDSLIQGVVVVNSGNQEAPTAVLEMPINTTVRSFLGSYVQNQVIEINGETGDVLVK